MDLSAAMRFARMIADRSPAFSQRILMQAHDALGTFGSRERAARSAEALGVLATTPEARAEAWLFAAETLHDLVRKLPEGPRRGCPWLSAQR